MRRITQYMFEYGIQNNGLCQKRLKYMYQNQQQ